MPGSGQMAKTKMRILRRNFLDSEMPKKASAHKRKIVLQPTKLRTSCEVCLHRLPKGISPL